MYTKKHSFCLCATSTCVVTVSQFQIFADGLTVLLELGFTLLLALIVLILLLLIELVIVDVLVNALLATVDQILSHIVKFVALHALEGSECWRKS